MKIRGSQSKRWAIGIVAGAIASTLAIAPSQAIPVRSEVGVSATEIVLGMQLPQTGPASPGYNKVDDAMRAYFDYVNSKGGVNGRKIKLVVKDDIYKAGLTISTASTLINKDKVFAMVGSVGTQTHISIIKDINRRGIPDLFVNSGYSGFYTDPKKYPTSFAGLGTYVVESKIEAEYLKANYAAELAAGKVGILYQTDDFGRNVVAGFKQQGVIFPAANSQNFVAGTHGSLGLTTQVKALQAAGVTLVVIGAVASATAVTIGTAAKLGFAPKWLVTSVGSDATTFKTILGAQGTPAAVSAALLTGVISASHAPSPGEDTDEFVIAFKKINDDFNLGDKTWDNNVLQGMNIGYLTTAALMGAGKDLTRKSLIAFMENKGATLSSAALSPLAYSSKTHEAYNSFWIGAYDANSVLKPISGTRVLNTTDSAAGPITVSTYKRPAIAADALPKVG
ncbi:MAG: ABC transporter substrate-binding protein [Actinobacteria bacterium]|nr:ABC transporter substrate-binding protein [Actinomycetota bacterium]